MRLSLLCLAPLALACAAPPPVPTRAAVRPGLEVLLDDVPAVMRGRRVGLITNQTAVDRQGVSAIDLLHRAGEFELVALYSPEHGIRGVAAAGEKISSDRDPRTGLPIHSLYGDTRKPTAEMLQGVEVLVFDIQDIGTRAYTYISTLALAREAAAERGIPLVVLDRPNPITGVLVEGGILDPRYQSFVGIHPIALRHGMTVGELARLFNADASARADITVVPAAGWRRDLWFDAVGHPWVNPSPNIRRLEAAIHYPGTVFLEGTNLSEGRGTDFPFEQTGAPWLDAPAVAAEMNARALPGVRFEAVTIPVAATASRYPGQTIPGVRMVVTDRDRYRPVRAALLMIDAIRRRHPADFRATDWLDRLAGTDRLRLALQAGTLEALLDQWNAEAAAFARRREAYLMY